MSYDKEIKKEADKIIAEQIRWRVRQAIKMQRYVRLPKDSIGAAIGYKRARFDILKVIRDLPL